MVSSNAIIAALSSTILISLAPNAFLLAFPHYASGEGESSQFLALGQALAAGGLLGDVFLHIIPHSIGGNGGGDNHDAGLWIMLGFTIFLMADMMIRSFGHSHTHSHSHSSHNPNHKDKQQQQEKQQHKDDNHHHNHKTATISLNLAADALHNFTDGLAIGASFSISGGNHNNIHNTGVSVSSILSLMKSRGGLATLSILFHEIPHELGDFAILVKNGFSKNQAIMAQFATAIAALVGTIVGLFLADGFAGGGNEDILMLITAGGFVYLAAVSILPELLEGGGGSECESEGESEENKNRKSSGGTIVRFRLAQLICFVIGIAFMHAVSLLESMDGGHGHGHGHAHSHGHHHHDHRNVMEHNDHAHVEQLHLQQHHHAHHDDHAGCHHHHDHHTEQHNHHDHDHDHTEQHNHHDHDHTDHHDHDHTEQHDHDHTEQHDHREHDHTEQHDHHEHDHDHTEHHDHHEHEHDHGHDHDDHRKVIEHNDHAHDEQQPHHHHDDHHDHKEQHNHHHGHEHDHHHHHGHEL